MLSLVLKIILPLQAMQPKGEKPPSLQQKAGECQLQQKASPPPQSKSCLLQLGAPLQGKTPKLKGSKETLVGEALPFLPSPATLAAPPSAAASARLPSTRRLLAPRSLAHPQG